MGQYDLEGQGHDIHIQKGWHAFKSNLRGLHQKK